MGFFAGHMFIEFQSTPFPTGRSDPAAPSLGPRAQVSIHAPPNRKERPRNPQTSITLGAISIDAPPNGNERLEIALDVYPTAQFQSTPLPTGRSDTQAGKLRVCTNVSNHAPPNRKERPPSCRACFPQAASFNPRPKGFRRARTSEAEPNSLRFVRSSPQHEGCDRYMRRSPVACLWSTKQSRQTKPPAGPADQVACERRDARSSAPHLHQRNRSADCPAHHQTP